ncbi:MAG: cob(I)yrinic acid a,c-diamide adenosyltransferase [Methanobacteriota archaeon]
MIKKGRGLVHVYTGEGKGKTTASMGLALRFLGHGMKVYVIQFLKGGKHIGEYIASKDLLKNFTVRQLGRPCPYSEQMEKGLIDCGNCRHCFETEEKDRQNALKGLKLAEEALTSGKYDLVILDEINVVLNLKHLKVGDVLKLIRRKHSKTNLVLTGRYAPKKIMDAADLVTEMREIKHPMKKGLYGIRGLEY